MSGKKFVTKVLMLEYLLQGLENPQKFFPNSNIWGKIFMGRALIAAHENT